MMMMQVTLVEKNIAPYGVKCIQCTKIAKAGQFVLMHTIPDVQHVIIHKKCCQDIIQTIPDDISADLKKEYSQIKLSYMQGKAFND